MGNVLKNLTTVGFVLIILGISQTVRSQDVPSYLPDIRFHLTSREWKPLSIDRDAYLDVLSGICHAVSKQQDERGAIIDPYLNREHQYSTPYYAFAVGTLLHFGFAEDLKDSGIRAMEHATECFAGGSAKIPDRHGEFFIAPLTGALELYEDVVPGETLKRWRERMKTPVDIVMTDTTGRINNWRTYAMKGEWLRAHAGLIPVVSAYAFIEKAWNVQTQRERIALDQWNLYQDWSSDPQSHAVEAVGRGNLTALVLEGYVGPSASEILACIRRGAKTSLLLQNPMGQCPPNGRTDDHVFNDLLYQLIFDAMAEDAWNEGDRRLSGQYRHAAMMSFRCWQRWRRTGGPFPGSYSITKNFFDPKDRVGYQPASQWGNYNGALMLHLAEAALARKNEIPEQPAPSEIGGYALQTDPMFSSFVANAGGMQVFANLRGASVPKYDIYWTPLGAVRFGRVGWDGRLGPSDGIHDPNAGEPLSFRRGSDETADSIRARSGITFGPAWLDRGQWVRIADVARHYRGTVHVDFDHPLLVRFHILYHYVTGRGGPYFRQEFTVTPDGVFTELHCLQEQPFALTVPLLENDGRPLQVNVEDRIARTSYEKGGDEQNFILLDRDAEMEEGGDSIQSTYGWLKPVRIQNDMKSIRMFVYPRSPGDPTAETVRDSFSIDKDGFSSGLARVEGNCYIGRTAAGGEGDGIDLNSDGDLDVTFSEVCQFILQLKDGTVRRVETGRNVTMAYRGQNVSLQAYEPLDITTR